MKNPRILSAPGRVVGRICFGVMLGFIVSTGPVGRAQPAEDDEQGGEVLTRGPVHEAFAGVVSYNPEPGVIVSKAPPELIEEIPPDEKPEGDDVAWIPGYWAWDDERNDFLWVSGTWRTIPPGREWMAGYWRDTGQGYQWISGYWADADAQDMTYLPPPPATLEVGANIDAPSDDYGWTPGCWVWQEDRYAWRAGYWAQGRADWVWVPAYYVWTPRGVIFVDGFWDYPFERRGLLFAPIYYQSRGYARRGYSYTPRIVISVSCFNDNLFLRPSYHHYYFGDYYGSRYERSGFFMSFSYQSGRRGYDPFYAHDRWVHRTERDWDSRYRAAYQYRRDHEAARPPRTWAAQVKINARPASAGQPRVVAAAPLAQVAARKDNPGRFQPVAQGDRQQLAQRGREVQQSRDSRQSVEAKAVVPAGRTNSNNNNRAAEPARVAAPRSPIVARPAAQRTGNQAPPARPQSPRADPKAPPRADAPAPVRPDARGRAPDADRSNPAAARQPERNVPAERRMPDRADKAREDAQREAQDAQKKAQQDAEQRTRETRDKAQATEKDRQQAVERAQAAAARAREETQQKVQQAEQQAKENAAQAQRDAEERGRADRARVEAQQKAQQQQEEKRANDRPEVQPNAQPPREEQRAREPDARDRNDDQPRREVPPPPRAQPGDDRRGPPAPNARPAPRPKPVEKPKPDDDDDKKKDPPR